MLTRHPRHMDIPGAIGVLFLVGALMAILARCQVVPPDEPPQPGPVYDTDPARDHCADACANLARLHCEWADPTPGNDGEIGTEDDGRCVDLCRNAQEDPETSLNPECVAAAESCEAAEACVR